MSVLDGLLTAVVVLLGGLLAYERRPRRRKKPTVRRLLVPFTGGELDPAVLDTAIRVARAEEATLVPAYLLVVPLRFAEDAPLKQEVEIAMPLLEAVEREALRAGIPVDARIEKGRSATQALQRLWETERFDRVIAPAPALSDHRGRAGFTAKDLTWILTQAPFETLVLKPVTSDS